MSASNLGVTGQIGVRFMQFMFVNNTAQNDTLEIFDAVGFERAHLMQSLGNGSSRVELESFYLSKSDALSLLMKASVGREYHGFIAEVNFHFTNHIFHFKILQIIFDNFFYFRFFKLIFSKIYLTIFPDLNFPIFKYPFSDNLTNISTFSNFYSPISIFHFPISVFHFSIFPFSHFLLFIFPHFQFLIFKFSFSNFPIYIFFHFT